MAHYRLTVQPMTSVQPGDAWALSYYDVDEEWGALWLPADEALPPETLELVVLHELAHGLVKIAASGDQPEEAVCNRIARLSLANWTTPGAEEHRAASMGESFYTLNDEVERKSGSRRKQYPHAGPRPGGGVERRPWLAIVSDALPVEQREVVTLLYWEGLSFREAASILSVDVHTVVRRKDKALATLAEYFAALDKKFAKDDAS